MLRIYTGLAVLNPSARPQINQFSKSVTKLFRLIKRADKEGLRERIYDVRDVVSTAHTMAAPATG
jgi:prephenate dehydrogenase (NADP+)